MAGKEGSDQIGGIPRALIGERGIVVKVAGQFQTVRQNEFSTAAVSTTSLLSSDAEIFVDASLGAVTLNLPAAATVKGRVYSIKKIDSTSNAVIVDPNGTEKVDGALTKSLVSQFAGTQIVSNGSNWFVRGSGGGSGGSGWIVITDVSPNGSGVVSNKTYQDAGNTVLQAADTSTTAVTFSLKSSFPVVDVNGTGGTLVQSVDGGHYAGTVNTTISGTGTFISKVITPDGDEGSRDTVSLTLVPGPELLTLSFIGGYPGSQTELKSGDTFDLSFTTDVPATALEIQDFGAFILTTPTFAPTIAGTVTGTIADRGTTLQSLPGRARARNASGAFGATRDTNTLGGTVDGTNLVKLNNLFPSFLDNGTTFPVGQTAFKGTEAGSQDTTVSNFNTILYSSPHGDFSIGATTTYLQNKPITCTNPGDYNDSSINFQISATRSANDATAVFTKTIEVADVAAIITVSQPQARLRSGGNDGTAVQSYLITATSNQNLAAAPDISIPVGGTFQGGGFAGGPKVFTRTIDIADTDTKGTAAWTLAGPVLNGAGTASTITGNQSNGGFVPRDVTFAAFSQTSTINVETTDYSKITAGIFTATNQPSIRNPSQGDTSDLQNTYTLTVLSNPGTVFWNDLSAANSNSSGTAQLLALEETV
jgi:hypothetical protein